MKNLLIYFFIAMLLGCTPKEDVGGSSFVYFNQTGAQVTVNVYNITLPSINGTWNEAYEIAAGEKFHIDYVFKGFSCTDKPFGGTADSVKIIFGNQKEKVYRKNNLNSRNPLLIGNYQLSSKSEDYCEYLYTITEEDYNNAAPIEEK